MRARVVEGLNGWFGTTVFTYLVPNYLILVALGAFLGTLWAVRRAKARGLDPDPLYGFILWVFPTALLGGRVIQWVVAPETHPTLASFVALAASGMLVSLSMALWPRFQEELLIRRPVSDRPAARRAAVEELAHRGGERAVVATAERLAEEEGWPELRWLRLFEDKRTTRRDLDDGPLLAEAVVSMKGRALRGLARALERREPRVDDRARRRTCHRQGAMGPTTEPSRLARAQSSSGLRTSRNAKRRKSASLV